MNSYPDQEEQHNIVPYLKVANVTTTSTHEATIKIQPYFASDILETVLFEDRLKIVSSSLHLLHIHFSVSIIQLPMLL